MLTRLSQFFNVALVIALVVLPFGNHDATDSVVKVRSAVEPGSQGLNLERQTKVAPLTFAQATPAPLPATAPSGATIPVVEGKPDAIVPPLARKKPAPAPTSVPIVAAPERKKAAPGAKAVAPKAANKPAAKPVVAPQQPTVIEKAPPPSGRSSLGGPVPTAACAVGMRYDNRQLRCVKGLAPRATPAAAAAPAAKRRPPATALH